MKKSAISIILIFACLVSFSACSRKQKEAKDDSSNSSIEDIPGGTNQTPQFITSAEGADTNENSIESGDTQAPPPAAGGTNTIGEGEDEDDIKTITGVIDDTTMGQFFIEVEGGLVIGFDYTDVDVSGLKDSRPGSPIAVHYTGTINGTDTSGIDIIKMETP